MHTTHIIAFYGNRCTTCRKSRWAYWHRMYWRAIHYTFDASAS